MKTKTDIPGFYYDEEKKKYFKIQPNHVAPHSDYSKEAVTRKRVAEDQQMKETARRTKLRTERIQKSTLSFHPMLDFRRQLGERNYSASRDVADYYCASMRPWSIFDPRRNTGVNIRTPGPRFAIDEQTGDLFWPVSLRGGSPWPSSCFLDESPLSPSHRGKLMMPWTTPHHQTQGMDLACVEVVNSQYVVFTETILETSTVNVIRLSDHRMSMDVDAPAFTDTISHVPRRQPDGTTHTESMVIFHEPSEIRELTTSPYEMRFAMATSDGVAVTQGETEHTMRVMRLPLDDREEEEREQMAVTFKDANLVLSGSRSGRLTFSDLRSSSPVATLWHSSAVSAIARHKSPNHIVVNGLSSMCIYDLRYVTPLSLHHQPRHRSRKPHHHKSYHPSPSPSEPYLNIHLPPATHTSDRYGLGFAYDPHLNLIAAARSNHTSGHHVSLYSASTGRVIESAPLNRRAFADQVSCLRFGALRHGPKSLVLKTGNRIEEWSVIGGELDEGEDNRD